MVFFHPPKAPIPTGFDGNGYVVREMRLEHAPGHYEAVSKSLDNLRTWSGGTWPPEGFSLEDDMKELEDYQRWHDGMANFSYVILSPEEDECFGAIHINSLMKELSIGHGDEDDLTTVTRYEGVCRFWVRSDLIAEDLDRLLLNALVDWFKIDWQFTRVLYRVNTNDLRQLAILSELGRKHLYVLDPPDREGKHILHG